MFKLTKQAFGKFKKYTFADVESGNSFSVVPEFGACVTDLTFGHFSVLDSYPTYEALIENKWSKSAFLYPFPNRLRDGMYTFQGRQYQFEINNPATGNAIHGFGKSCVMTTDDILCTKNSAQVRCTYVHHGDHPAYPFPFECAVGMAITQDGRFEVEMTFTNTGDGNLPVGLGWHPYFKIADTADQVSMQLPACQKILIDDRMLPTGKTADFNEFTSEKTLLGTRLDNCFRVPEGNGRFEMHLRSERGKLQYWQMTGPKGFGFVQLFTPDHRQSVAIEPMTCNVDAFNNGDGLTILGPGTSFRGRFGISWSAVGK